MRSIYTCILWALIYVISTCLTVHTHSPEIQNNDDKNHQNINSLATHQQAQIAQAVIFGLQTALFIDQLSNSVFQGTCSTISVKKVNWINIKNELDDSLRFGGIYLAEGGTFQNGEPIVRKNQTIRWILAQKSMFSGSRGMIVYRIRDGTNNSLIVYTNNPTGLNSWNSFGACIIPETYPDSQAPLSQDILRNQYNLIVSQLGSPPQNCILSDNSKNHVIPEYQKIRKVIKSGEKQYIIAMVGKYEQNKQFFVNCYRQQVIAVIGPA